MLLLTWFALLNVVAFCLFENLFFFFTSNMINSVLIYANNRTCRVVNPYGLSQTFLISNIYFTTICRILKTSTIILIHVIFNMRLTFLSFGVLLFSLYFCYLVA